MKFVVDVLPEQMRLPINGDMEPVEEMKVRWVKAL